MMTKRADGETDKRHKADGQYITERVVSHRVRCTHTDTTKER
jgi:hypothetical protein